MSSPAFPAESQSTSAAEKTQDDASDGERNPKRAKGDENVNHQAAAQSADPATHFAISVAKMTGTIIVINDAAAADTIISVKQRAFAVDRTLYVPRQRLVYSAGPRGSDPLADDETLGGAGVAQDGSAVLDVLLVDLTDDEKEALGGQLLVAARHRNFELAREYLDGGVSVEFKSKALTIAVSWGHIEFVRQMLDAGADTEYADENDHYPALIDASAEGRADIVQLLLERGADVTATDRSSGDTALMWAIKQNHPAVVNVFLSGHWPACLSARGNHDQTPLMCAASRGRYAIMLQLLDAGASTADVDNLGNTALILSMPNGDLNCMRTLVDAGRDELNFTNNNGCNALHQAVSFGRLCCVKLLLERGVNLATKTKSGMDALEIASRVEKLGDYQTNNDRDEIRRAILAALEK